MRTVQEGQLRGAFRGFHDRNTVFEFIGGGKWRQNVYKYHYHYEYQPAAKVVSDGVQNYLHVDGMEDTVPVVRG